jgi:flagellar hook protein FlgE
MNGALLSGVSGLDAHQKMLDVAGNNLSNVSTTAFKGSRVSFAEMLGNTIRQASQPTDAVGGTNPQQVGSGVIVSSIDRDMTQGSVVSTGRDLDMAVDGSGYFVLSDGKGDVYTRVGSFAIDQDYYLVDPATGYRVQRIGSEGEAEGFQEVSSTGIRIPFDTALPAKVTESINYTGNLSADEAVPSTNMLSSGIQYTKDDAVVNETARFDDIQQASGLTASDQITISGTLPDGSAVGPVVFDLHDGSDFKTIGELVTEIQTAFPGTTVSLSNGEIRITDNEAGYSLTDVQLAFGSASPTASFELPNYFKLNSVGGELSKSTNIEVYDSQGVAHTLSASFVKTDVPNKWDLVVTSVTGEVELIDRRVSGITFMSNGAFGGVDDADGSAIKVRYLNDPLLADREVNLNLGTVGQFDGLSQFGGPSTVAPNGQDGYAPGWLSSTSVSREGVLVGVFTNGVRQDLAALKLATFQNAAGLESIGNSYFTTSANSGNPVLTKGMSGNAGAIRGGSLERSNVEVAAEFVNMIQAQNGFQANARSIRVANEMLQELTNLIR